MADPFDILGVQPNADAEVIDAAYRALMKKHHPDRRGGSADVGKAQQINAAYAAIKSRAAFPLDDQNAISSHEAPTSASAAPLRPGRNLAWALLASAAILAIMATIATS